MRPSNDPPHELRSIRLKPGQLAPPGSVPFVEGRFGLWVPRDAVTQPTQLEFAALEERPEILRYAVITVSWRSLTGQTATLADVVRRLSSYSVRQVTNLVGRLTIALSTGDGAGSDLDRWNRQVQVLTKLIGADAAEGLVDLVGQREGGGFNPEQLAFFHERQVLSALKIAFLTGELDDEGRPVGDLSSFVEALLMLNDLIEPPEGAMGPLTSEGQRAMELYIAANTLFNESPSLLNDYVRAHFLYIEPRPEVAALCEADVPARLLQATGMQAEIVWHALFALYGFWGTCDEADVDAGRIAVSRSEYLSNLTKLPDELRSRWFELATWDAHALQARMRRDFTLDDPRFWDVLPFEERPLIAFGEQVFCASVPLLRRLPGSSIQHRLQDRAVFHERETREFRNSRGHLVELYTRNAMARAFGDRFIPEDELKRYAAGASVCDGIIVYPDGLILLECKTVSPLLDTRHAANYEAYRAQWARTTTKACTQFMSTLELLKQDALRPLGIVSSSLGEIYPVIAVFEQPVNPLMYRSVMERDVAEHPLTQLMRDGSVKPLQLAHIRDIESWECAAEQGRSVLDLLRAKTTSKDLTEMSFLNFVHLRGETFQNTPSAWHAAQFAKMTDGALTYFREVGLAEENRAEGM